MEGCEDSVVHKFDDSRQLRSGRLDAQTFKPRQRDLKSLPIGVFDSGVGGLTVLKELQKSLPNESFVYFGDTANVPYGGRSPEDLLTLTRRILDWMSHTQVKMAIMACNTSSAWALEHVREEYPFPVLGIILPVAKVARSLGSRLGVIATKGTVESSSYAQAIQEVDPSLAVFQMACPEFVPLIEQGKLDDWEIHRVIEMRLSPLVEANIDALILGCTHYPHLKRAIRRFLPAPIQIVDPAIYIAKAAQQELDLLRLNAGLNAVARTDFFVSACPEQFGHQIKQLLSFFPTVTQVDLASIQLIPLVS
jgi:glutamate racemase